MQRKRQSSERLDADVIEVTPGGRPAAPRRRDRCRAAIPAMILRDAMPNAANIDSPIVLIGAGRSGTSLVSKIFDLHPDCVGVGETANLIFGPWRAVELSSASIAPLVEHDAWVAEAERAGRVVRQTFLTCFPDDRAHWMQKPIGVPKAVSDRFDDELSPEAAAWYWQVLTTSFPRARCLAILRHPCDVVLSARSRWGFSDRSLWRMIAVISSYLLHPDSPVRWVVRYDDLVTAREASVRRLCDAAELPFLPDMLAGFDDVHVPAPGREDLSQSGFTRRVDWSALDPLQLHPSQRELITAAFDRFAGGLEWPAHFDGQPSSADAAAGPSPSPEALELRRLRVQVTQLSQSVERAMFDHAEVMRRRDEAWQQRERTFGDEWRRREHEFAAREREATRLWQEQQDWIAELERVKVWLQEQLDYWRKRAEGA
jgi:hypothetical protein